MSEFPPSEEAGALLDSGEDDGQAPLQRDEEAIGSQLSVKDVNGKIFSSQTLTDVIKIVPAPRDGTTMHPHPSVNDEPACE